MAPQQRRKMSVYERMLEKIARMPVGDWYLKRIAPRLDPPLLRLTGGRVSSVYPVPVLLLTTTGAKTGCRARFRFYTSTTVTTSF
jgi:hypothetical protein